MAIVFVGPHFGTISFNDFLFNISINCSAFLVSPLSNSTSLFCNLRGTPISFMVFSHCTENQICACSAILAVFRTSVSSISSSVAISPSLTHPIVLSCHTIPLINAGITLFALLALSWYCISLVLITLFLFSFTSSSYTASHRSVIFNSASSFRLSMDI